MDGKGYVYLEILDREPFTIIQASCNFSPLLIFEFGSIRRCLAFPGKIHR